MDIGVNGSQTIQVRVPALKLCTADTQLHRVTSIDLTGSPYSFSLIGNIWVMRGCAGSAVLLNHNAKFIAGCATTCHNNESVIYTNKCYGVDCCITELLDDNLNNYSLQSYQIHFHGQPSGKPQNCLVASLIDLEHVGEYIGKLSIQDPHTVPIVLLWRWISSLRPDHNNPNSRCAVNSQFNSLSCSCDSFSFGINPYVTNGCQVPKNCKDCHGSCIQGVGNTYFCQHEINISGGGIILICFVLGFGFGPLLIMYGGLWLLSFIRRQKKVAKRVKFFKLKLQAHQSSNDGIVESTKLFTHKELSKATNYFNDNRVLGKGGQGTVYKGMLTEGKIVAVKKSKLMDEIQMEQFINEVVILSLINHRNVVKLLGCCLETEVPLLVYEFISNGTLQQHIHNPVEDFVLNWAMRLKIAVDSAGAIAYLHSSSSTPVYHRDIKSANILLDEKHRAKVSDFGSSKTVEIDQTHLTTLVQGTIGYLDPEYFESGMFTEKSDVYSFGVVLLELLTGKKPVYRSETMEQKSLVIEFFMHLQNLSLINILDPEVVQDAKDEELTAYADLAKRCLNDCGRFRPTMKEVAVTLEMIIKSPAEISTQNQFAGGAPSQVMLISSNPLYVDDSV